MPYRNVVFARAQVTEEERNKVEGMCANLTEWLEAKSAEQAKLSPHETPAFLSSQVKA